MTGRYQPKMTEWDEEIGTFGRRTLCAEFSKTGDVSDV